MYLPATSPTRACRSVCNLQLKVERALAAFIFRSLLARWTHLISARCRKRWNLLASSNADRYVYASYSDEPLLRFLHNHFVGVPAPVRTRDPRPIGSPAA